MRLRTVAKLGVVLSVVLFCIAVGFYGFTRLSMTDRGRGVQSLLLGTFKQYWCFGKR